MLGKPSHSLEKGLLLGPLLNLDAGVAANSKAVHDSRVQVNLERQASLDENLLRLVALLGREDVVCLGGGNRQRASDGSQLVLFHHGGMGDVADVNAVLVVANHVLCAEAVANGSDSLDAQILERLDGIDNDGVDGRGSVRVVASRALGDPGRKVKVASPVQ